MYKCIVLVAALVAMGMAIAADPPAHQCARLLQRACLDSPYATLNKQSKSIFRRLYEHVFGIKQVPYNPSSALDPEAKYAYVSNVGEVKIYRPELFSKIRVGIGISEESYINALSTENLSCLRSDSKSGQAFWVSNDGSIVLKTLKHYEVCNLRGVLDSYYGHLIDSASCIASILGIYRVTTHKGVVKYFMVNRNVYPSPIISKLASSGDKMKDGKNIVIRKWDLKGSTIGRRAAVTSTVMKDLDLMDSGQLLQLGATKEFLLQTLERDVRFLRTHKFMDYSLLVAETSNEGHHAAANAVLRHSSHLGRVLDHKGKLVLRGENGRVYYFGIIDFLQKYSVRKSLETMLKGLLYDKAKISCVNPVLYARRMIAFINKFCL